MKASKSGKTADLKRVRSQVLERRVLREEIRDELIEDILHGRLAPGDRLVETRIARRFGVSQAPVREALRDLELLGFIVSSPFRGAIVRQLSVEDLDQIYPIRSALEAIAAHEAATRMKTSGLKRLEKLLATMRRAAARGDKRAAVDADFAFHLTIVDASGNRLLKQFWERMRLATTTLLTLAKTHRSLPEIAERHRLVLDALRARDPDAAERAMRQHIDEPRQWLRAAMEDAEARAEADAQKLEQKGSPARAKKAMG